jgi:hypothetical protein
MSHLTSWLLALTLIGSPVTGGLCAVMCGHASAPTAHCHDELTESMQPVMSSEAVCASAIADGAYVFEGSALPHVAMLPDSGGSLPNLTDTGDLIHRLNVPITVGWVMPRLVLRL